MNDPTRAPVALTSPHWYRVRDLAPAWNPDCSLSRRASRGGVTMIVGLDGTAARFALNEAAWSVIGRCDGRTGLGAIWQSLADLDPERLPPQADLIALVSRLVDAGILVCGDWPDLDTRLAREAGQRRRERAQRLNPLAPRGSLGSPQALLERARPVGGFVFSRAGAGVFALLALVALTVAFGHFGELRAHAVRILGDWRQWWLPVLCYPILKAIHELAHGLAIRRLGGRVHEAGIGLLLGMPAPYVDASAAEDFARPSERALVSAAGILAEISVAALALLLWSVAAPGVLRDACVVMAVLGGVSTVLFNGNPLVRLDGYYALTDLLNLPRLAEDSRTAWQGHWRRILLGLPGGLRPSTALERAAVTLYAPAAWLYRATLLFWVAGWVGSVSRVAGLSLLALATLWLLVLPVGRLLRIPLVERVPLRARLRAWSRAGLALAGIGLIALAPLPDRAWIEGVIRPAEASWVRNTDAGVVYAVLAHEGETVRAGQPIVLLGDPDLDAEIERMRTAHAGLKADWLAKLQSRSAEAASAREQLRQSEQRLSDLLGRRARLRVTAPDDGRLRYVGAPSDLPGRHLPAGSDVAVIDGGASVHVRALADQFLVSRLAEQGSPERVAVVDRTRGRLVPARLVVDAPTAVARLPHPAMAAPLGGAVAASRDPRSGDWRPLTAHYPVTAALPPGIAGPMETRARVLLSFGTRPLILQLRDRLVQSIAPRLSPDWS